MKGYLKKAYCFNQTMRIYAAITTDIVKHAQKTFNMWPTSISAFGRALTISAIMSCTYKSGEYLNIKVNGDGPIGPMTIEATDGNVRGFVKNPGVFLQYSDGKLNVAQGVGAGTIEVIKDLHMRQPFSSSCEIISGEIAEDFAYYYAISEQIPSAVALGVLVNKNGSVKKAGGYILQALPDTPEQILELIENTCRNENITTVIITHNSAIAPMADRIIKFRNGKPEEVILNNNPQSVKEIEW